MAGPIRGAPAPGFGALLLGVYDGKTLVYAGHVGTGFDERELVRLIALLKPLETKTCPFSAVPPSTEKPHWVKPTLVAQVRFTEWTDDGVLRHPVYLGVRDDKKAASVTRESRRARQARQAGSACGHTEPRTRRSEVRCRRQFAPGVGPRRQ